VFQRILKRLQEAYDSLRVGAILLGGPEEMTPEDFRWLQDQGGAQNTITINRPLKRHPRRFR